MGTLARKVVIVTGAGSGIGRAIAERFLAAGAEVVAADLKLDGAPADAMPVKTDVSVPDDVDRLVTATFEAHGRVDVLCNNAGIGSTSTVLSCSVEEWDRVFAVNVRGVFLGIRAVLPHMLRQHSGVIVNTASAAGLVGLPHRAAYCASKGAVIALTKQVAVEVAGTGVRCNSICPGTVDTPWVNSLLDQADDREARRRALIARQPVGRLGSAEEIAAAALYLASDEASFVTGAQLVIDGGLTAGPAAREGQLG
ncbi:MAG: SDR family NAD(P)-dependent oxidoreductase [Micromonosporaceae bacterium]